VLRGNPTCIPQCLISIQDSETLTLYQRQRNITRNFQRVASPVQFLSDSDQTEDTLSPAPNSENNQDFMEASDDDDDLLEINVSNPQK
jgi:hypothetical protein